MSREGAWAAILLAPFCLCLLLFQYFAIILLVRNSFFSYSLLNSTSDTFIGLGNYRELIHDPTAIQSIEVTLLFAAATVVLQVPLGLGLALLLNTRRRGVTILRGVVFAPVIVSVVVVTTMWTFIYAPTGGLANSVLHTVGIGAQNYIASQQQALPSIVLVTLWEEVGFAMILFLAGLQGIPATYEEAAAMDGAGPVRRFWHITLPLLRRTTVVVVVVSTIFALQAFAQPYIMTSGGPAGATNFMVYDVYQQTFALGNPGYGSALAVVLLAIVLIISLVQMRLVRSRVEQYE
jgi:ABC-type sugar transport system permease subunit